MSKEKQPEELQDHKRSLPSGVFPRDSVYTLLTTIPFTSYEEAARVAFHYMGYPIPSHVTSVTKAIPHAGDPTVSEIMLQARDKLLTRASETLRAEIASIQADFEVAMQNIEVDHPSNETNMGRCHPRQKKIESAIDRIASKFAAQRVKLLFVTPRAMDDADPHQVYSNADYPHCAVASKPKTP